MDGDALWPIVTLMLGAAIGWVVKRSETRRTEAVEAGDILAELPNYVWRQGGTSSWINLQVFLARLRTRLRAAGVPDDIARAVRRAALKHWQGCYEIETDYGTGWAATDGHVEALEQAVDDAQLWLFHRLNWWQRHKAKKRHATQPLRTRKQG